MRRYLLLASVLILLPTVSSARTWYILPDGSGDAPTIQEGINRAEVGDTVLVGPGTYYENIEFMGRDIVVKSEMGPEVTTIDGSHKEDSVVKIWKGETRATVLEGLTITGGTGYGYETGNHYGGGVFCRDSSPQIVNNHIIKNGFSTNGFGGGIAVLTSIEQTTLASPVLTENVIAMNSSGQNGGGIGVIKSDSKIVGNTVQGNECRADGAGLWIWQYEGRASVIDNRFVANIAGDHGGGAYVCQYWHGGPYEIIGNLFMKNRTKGTGFFGDTGSGGGLALLSISGQVVYNTFVENDGTHLRRYGGGGVLFWQTDTRLIFSNNIVARNIECGVACWDSDATVGVNLFWQNEGGDLGGGERQCPELWTATQIFADPLFCNPALEDYQVAQSSPAMGGTEVLGAFDTPGCEEVPVRVTTWGRLKSMYR